MPATSRKPGGGDPPASRVSAPRLRLPLRNTSGKADCLKNTLGFGLESDSKEKKERNFMLSWALTFLIIALIAAVLGFGGIAGSAAWIAQVLFVLFIIMFLLSFLFRGRPPSA
jgi:uncharacterized membrane protein YtjA (UPF0391 family)